MAHSFGCNPCLHTSTQRPVLGRKAFCEHRCGSAKQSSSRSPSQRVCCKAAGTQDADVCLFDCVETSETLSCVSYRATVLNYAVNVYGCQTARLRRWSSCCSGHDTANDDGTVAGKEIFDVGITRRLTFSNFKKSSTTCCRPDVAKC